MVDLLISDPYSGSICLVFLLQMLIGTSALYMVTTRAMEGGGGNSVA